MSTAPTSVLAYHQHVERGETGRQAAAILARIKASSAPMSRNELADATGFALASVCGRVNELTKAGEVMEAGVRRCPRTGRLVQVLRATP